MESKIPPKAFELSGYNENRKREAILSYDEVDAHIEQDFDVQSSEPLFSTDFLAILAHRLWTHWSQHIAEEEDISQERLDRWQDLWIEFDQLSPDMKEKDQELVNRFLDEKPDYSKKTGETE